MNDSLIIIIMTANFPVYTYILYDYNLKESLVKEIKTWSIESIDYIVLKGITCTVYHHVTCYALYYEIIKNDFGELNYNYEC